MKINTEYLDRNQCDTIKGVCILLVFVSHFMQYVAKAGGYVINLYIGQLMVAPFLFFSGYGVMKSIQAKGRNYVMAMPKRRILSTLINFDIAVSLYALLNLVLSHPMSFAQVMLSFIGWDSVGNSNWYIFVILLCYAVSFIAGLMSHRPAYIALITGLGCFVCMIALSYVKSYWWYDTILCFPAGMLYAEFKSSIECFLERIWPIALFLTIFAVICLMIRCPVFHGVGWNVKAVLFVFMIILVIMRFPFRNGALGWLGHQLFPIYIYQRIPMILLFELFPLGFADWRMPLFMFLSFGITVIIATSWNKWQVKF